MRERGAYDTQESSPAQSELSLDYSVSALHPAHDNGDASCRKVPLPPDSSGAFGMTRWVLGEC